MTTGMVSRGVALVSYLGVGYILTRRATDHLKDPDKIRLFTPLNNPDEFAPEGRRALAIANRYWLWATIGLVLFAILT